MHFAKRPLPKHRRARLIASTLALLLWMAQVLLGAVVFTARHERQRGARMSLDRIARQVKLLIISRAADLSGVRPRRPVRAFRGRRIDWQGAINAAIGARVKRLLKRTHIGERIAVLVHALANLDDYAVLVAKRLRRGMTRRWRVLFAFHWPLSAAVRSLAAPGSTFADSS